MGSEYPPVHPEPVEPQPATEPDETQPDTVPPADPDESTGTPADEPGSAYDAGPND